MQERLAGDDLVGQHKKRRMEKLERIKGIVEGREGREGAWKDRHEKKKAAGKFISATVSFSLPLFVRFQCDALQCPEIRKGA